MSTLFKNIKFLFFLLSGGICSVLIVELCLRFIELTPAWKVFPVAEVSLYGVDEHASYTHRPNVSGIWVAENRAKVSITDFGIRSNGLDVEIIEQNDNVLKIGIIGDSMVEALQVDDDKTFSAILEKELNLSGNKTRVYNLGLAGATPTVKAIRAKKYADLLNLDIIFFIEHPYSISHISLTNKGSRMPYYKINNSGEILVDKSFQKSQWFQLRKTIVGRTFYTILDNSRVFTMLNSRMNRGIFEELNQAFQRASKKTNNGSRVCDQKSLRTISTIGKAENQKISKIFDFFTDQLANIQQENKTKIIFSLYNTWTDCEQDIEKLANLNLKKLLDRKQIEFFNLKEAIKSDLPNHYNLNKLRGFGLKIGNGHLNYKGHNVFANALKYHVKSEVETNSNKSKKPYIEK